MPHLVYILFFFALGSCVGSFLNVVVWRLPKVEPVENESMLRGILRTLRALSEPPSHCPKCQKLLRWQDNIPVLGWVKLGGKCHFCKQPFSIRYPIVEAVTGLMFAGYYAAFFVWQIGPISGVDEFGRVLRAQMFLNSGWWVYSLDMALLSGLLACSLIDAEMFIIPPIIPWTTAIVAIIVHAIFDSPAIPGSIIADPLPAAIGAGGLVGLILSIILLERGILKPSFADGAPMLEVERKAAKASRAADTSRAAEASGETSAARNRDQGDVAIASDAEPREWSRGEVRREMGKEMLFLLAPMALAIVFCLAAWQVGPLARAWNTLLKQQWLGGLFGSVLGALVGGFVVWATRILGSLVFGREAMGIGDVDLMAAVGAVLGAGPATVAFFIAPFFGILFALYSLISRKQREIPYGPYLSLATAFVMLFYGPIASYFAPGLANLHWMLFGGR